MVDAYVLIQAEPGKAGRDVSRSVASVRGILAAQDVSGPYDVIARAQASNLDQLMKVVVGRIQAIEGVMRTLVCPVVSLS